MSDWKPITEDVKDGRWVILAGQQEIELVDEYNPVMHDYGSSADGLGMAICRYQNGTWRDQWDDYYGPEYATHYMPVPELPR